MILGIDASNIRVGGGLTHLKELLSSVDIENHNIEKIIVWSSDKTLVYFQGTNKTSQSATLYLSDFRLRPLQ